MKSFRSDGSRFPPFVVVNNKTATQEKEIMDGFDGHVVHDSSGWIVSFYIFNYCLERSCFDGMG